MNITNNNLSINNKLYELEENSNDYLKDLSNYIPNLLNHLWECPELVALILNNSNLQDIKDNLAPFIVNHFYDNILLSNSIENNLMLVLTLMLKEEINNLKDMNKPEVFLNNNSRCHYLLNELIKKDNIRQYFKKVLLNIIEKLEAYSSDKVFNLNLKNFQNILKKKSERNLNDDIIYQNKHCSVKSDDLINLKYINNPRINHSYSIQNKINENIFDTNNYEVSEIEDLGQFSKKYVENLTINEIKKMIEEKYNDNENMKDYCTNQLINCVQNIINRDYY